ncbi:unnamed protein product [Protopolystoma xenopodis]|uniref:Uncharacterized protein n=1 Tax=Protopolystoma xenopodis TaxID=117903 RepID=A0A3S5A296_9PLAT|nr:unnamed protein product [Protopolystoma xenopodis]
MATKLTPTTTSCIQLGRLVSLYESRFLTKPHKLLQIDRKVEFHELMRRNRLIYCLRDLTSTVGSSILTTSCILFITIFTAQTTCIRCTIFQARTCLLPFPTYGRADAWPTFVITATRIGTYTFYSTNSHTASIRLDTPPLSMPSINLLNIVFPLPATLFDLPPAGWRGKCVCCQMPWQLEVCQIGASSKLPSPNVPPFSPPNHSSHALSCSPLLSTLPHLVDRTIIRPRSTVKA